MSHLHLYCWYVSEVDGGGFGGDESVKFGGAWCREERVEGGALPFILGERVGSITAIPSAAVGVRAFRRPLG